MAFLSFELLDALPHVRVGPDYSSKLPPRAAVVMMK